MEAVISSSNLIIRFATVSLFIGSTISVSYTHLDVYKRQHIYRNLVQGSNPNIASYVASNTKIMKKSLERFVTESYLG